MNAIDDDLPRELSAAVDRTDADTDIHVTALSGKSGASCAGYDLAHDAEGKSAGSPSTGV
ncbi:MAG: hypothetical protein ACR2RA_17890 [Geminicoccaceae bacterium]